MSFPVSSHDMLKSVRTCLVRVVMIEGAITLLWIPRTKRKTRMMLEIVKKGLLNKDCVKDTSDVLGSVSQCHAPTAVQIDTTASKILHLVVDG